MSLKEFLKPTKTKILLSFFIPLAYDPIIASPNLSTFVGFLEYYKIFYPMGVILTIYIIPMLFTGNYSITAPAGEKVVITIDNWGGRFLELLLFVYFLFLNYLVICLIVYLFNKFIKFKKLLKNKQSILEKKKSKK